MPETPLSFTVPCKFCNGLGSVADVSKWPPRAVCPGCKGAGVHVLTAGSAEPPAKPEELTNREKAHSAYVADMLSRKPVDL